MNKNDEYNTEPLAIGDYCQVTEDGLYKDIYVKIIQQPNKKNPRYVVQRSNGWGALNFKREHLVKVEPSIQSALEYQEAHRYG